jgi:hypothetical protein
MTPELWIVVGCLASGLLGLAFGGWHARQAAALRARTHDADTRKTMAAECRRSFAAGRRHGVREGWCAGYHRGAADAGGSPPPPLEPLAHAFIPSPPLDPSLN